MPTRRPTWMSKTGHAWVMHVHPRLGLPPLLEAQVVQLTTRLHLGLSDTFPGVFIKPENVNIIPDTSTFILLHTASRPLFVLTVIVALQSEMDICSPTVRELSRGRLRGAVGGNTIPTTI
jgi:hypothetical protein